LASVSTNVGSDYDARSRKNGKVRTQRWLTDYVWAKAKRQVAQSPAVRRELNPDLVRLLGLVNQIRWPRKAMSDRNVYTAILNKALVIGERLVNAPIRELAELAGIASHATVHHCGWISPPDAWTKKQCAPCVSSAARITPAD
jgi:hypothetical protein